MMLVYSLCEDIQVSIEATLFTCAQISRMRVVVNLFVLVCLVTNCYEQESSATDIAQEKWYLETFDGRVLLLNDDTFDQALSKYSLLIVDFFVPWCSYCRELEPQWAAAAEELHDIELPPTSTVLAKVDALHSPLLADRFELGRVFPAIKYFKNSNSNPHEYDGGRTAADIIRWVKKRLAPPTIIYNVDQLTQLQASCSVLILALLDDLRSDVARAYTEFAQQFVPIPYQETLFAVSASQDLRSSLYKGTAPTELSVLMLKSFDDSRSDYHLPPGGHFDTQPLNTFIQHASLRELQIYNSESSKRIFASPIRNIAFIFTPVTDNSNTVIKDSIKKDLDAQLHHVVKQFKDRVQFVIVEGQPQMANFYGVNGSLPSLVLVNSTTTPIKRYPLHEPFQADSVRAHIVSYLGSDLKPAVRSQKVLPEDMHGLVKEIRGDSFDVVLNTDADVLLMIYAPWDDMSKRLEPIYEMVASHYYNKKRENSKVNVMVAKMDGTNNEVPVTGFDIRGYPAVFFVPSVGKLPVRFTEGWLSREQNKQHGLTLKTLTHFVDRHLIRHDEL